MYGNTPLLICAENGFIDIVRFLLLRKADINAFNSAGDSALILSTRASGSSTIAIILLSQKGIDINHQNQDGYTALMRAIEVKDVRSVKMLMDEYYKRNVTFNQAVNCKGETVHQIAERCGLGKIVQILNEHDRKVLPLVVATEACDIETFNILLDCQFVDESEMKTAVNAAFRQKFTNYEMEKVKTINYDEIVMIRRLLECGVDMETNQFNHSLVVAVKMGNYQLVELLCQHLDQHQQLKGCSSGTDVLKAAAETGRCDLVKLLLHYQADVNQDVYSCSPLDNALSHGHLECAQLLVQHGARMDINHALLSAVKQQVSEYMNFLFHNYKPDVLNFAVNNADQFNDLLLEAGKGGNLEMIQYLFDAGPVINHVSFSEETPLGVSKTGEDAKLLVSKGANVNHVTHGRNTLLLNVLLDRRSISKDLVNVFLDNGSSVNERCIWDRTPLILAACKKGSVGALQALLDRGAGFNDQHMLGDTPLMAAIWVDCLQNVSFLLQFAQEKKHCINVQDKSGHTALMVAVMLKRIKIVKLLIDHGADVNIRDEYGNTALLLSVPISSRSTKAIMTVLIEAGSDVNSQNKNGFSPLMIAAKRHRHCLISILLDSGADVNAVSKRKNTKTALTILTEEGDFNKKAIFCLKTLLERGASSLYVSPIVLYIMIFRDEIYVIAKLIQNGLRLFNVDRMSMFVDDAEWRRSCFFKKNIAVSPLRVALMAGNVPLAHYFVGKLFLTNSDIYSFVDDDFRCHLEKKNRKESLNFLDEHFSQPMSLFQLAFVSVSSAVGTSPGRETRVNLLPLPEVIKDKLLFKSGEVTLSIPAEDRTTVFSDTSDSYDESYSELKFFGI